MDKFKKESKKESKDELLERVVHIGRVTKVVRGGRNFRFTALVVVGDGNGKVGIGTGKAAEVPEAIKKAIQDGKKILLMFQLLITLFHMKLQVSMVQEEFY